MEWDEAQRLPREIFTKMGELGLMGVLFPEEYGGAGMGYVEYATVIEEIARVDGSIGLSVAAHNSLCTNHIFQYGSEAQRKKYVTPLARGERLGAWGLTEPSSGSDASGMKTTAMRRDGGWVINGSKNFITHGISADVCVVIAITNREMRSRGISAFVVEKGTKGFIAGKKENKLGMRASETASIIFEDCWIPEENLIGETGRSGRRSHLDRRAGARHSARRIRIGLEIFAGAQTVRPGDLRLSGNPVQTRRYGHADRRRAIAHPARGMDERQQAPDDKGISDGQALRLGDRGQSR
jgi:alkylation response protein AidB-like acyl-CoA dehydrogenase